jgi:hypothetical protein
MANLLAAVQEHRNLRAELLDLYPDLATDDQALADTLQGESRLDRVVARVITAALEREAMADGITAYIKTLQDRRSRLTVGAEKLRAMALWALQEAGIKKLEEPNFTALTQASQPSVVIIDEEMIPAEFTRIKVEPNKKLIAEVLKAGKEVPGCQLSNRRQSLVVRVS